MIYQDTKIDHVIDLLGSLGNLSIAVSGGIDSLTLAVIAGRAFNEKMRVFHAVSPAVPIEATDRVKQFATQERWNLTVFSAGEFEDANYVSNPVNRCYYCKKSLYSSIAKQSNSQILSGTNLDDLADYRPGLQAAQSANVRHPFAELRVNKFKIRVFAKELGLGSLATLPSSPCLSSRIETGISIAPNVLGAVHRVETLLSGRFASQTLRCRVRRNEVTIELDSLTLKDLTQLDRSDLTAEVFDIFTNCDLSIASVSFQPYRMGSAFLVSHAI